ncbi:MAG: PHP domain-containing protein [Firmicutes bacterium]|nr:PHP domain-containing protein [Bacillota bacterium]
MIVDLHVHTSVFSSCSSLDPEEAVQTAKKNRLDGICFTDHCRVWPAAELERLSARWDFPVFSGMEVETREGHMLVFGLGEDLPGLTAAGDLRAMVDRAAGVMIYAHPFRGFLLFGFSDLQMTVTEACGRPAFQMVEAIETFSGKSTKGENNLALEVSKRLSLPGVGGSDAHSAREIGRCLTVFNNKIRDTAELVNQLKKGEYRAGYPEK